ncbi:hypothetical protein ACVWYH_007823 [Bradyrhizobium sp. GM24.11]
MVRVFDTGLADFDYLLGDQLGERVVPIFYADGAQGLFVSRGKPGNLFRP